MNEGLAGGIAMDLPAISMAALLGDWSISGLIGAVALALIVLIGAGMTIRDKLLEAGLNWPRWLVRTGKRAAARRVTKDVAFLESEFLEGVANAIDVAVARKKIPSEMLEHPDRELLAAIKDWTIELGPKVDFNGLRHYVNTMGAISASEDRAATFATITHAWLTVLQQRGVIKPFDCLLSIKDGNPILVHGLAQRMHRSQERPIRAVFCKGEKDAAKVSSLHETDFEGLRTFRANDQLARCKRLRAIAVDDNCTSGESLFGGIQRFNRFVADRDEYPFDPIDTAVVLFAVKTAQSNAFEESDQVKLHALLALGDKEMERVRTEKVRDLKRAAHEFKDAPACFWSKSLDDVAVPAAGPA